MKWIQLTNLGNWRCPWCGTDFVFARPQLKKYRYCPYCGEEINGKDE